MQLQNTHSRFAMLSGTGSETSAGARIRPRCPVRPSCIHRPQAASQMRQQHSRRLHQPAAAVAAPDRAPDAEQAPQQKEEPAEAQQLVSPAAVDAAEAAEAPAFDVPKLADLQIQAIINTKGYVSPDVPPGTAAAVFAIYDAHQKLQYIGFSKDLRPSLKTLLGRRPDKAFFFKSVQLPDVNQDQMLAIRQAWFDECGAPPPGNKLALERKAWQAAVDAGAISARAKPAAAAEKVRELLALLKQRGCVEEFVPDTELMANGQVDFLTGPSQQQQQQQEGDTTHSSSSSSSSGNDAAAGEEGSGNPVHTCTVVVDGQAKQFRVEYLLTYPTKGGHMFDVKLSFDHMDTTHRIIVGKPYYEPYGITPQAPVEAALALLLSRKMPRHNEGMLGTAEFPVNYFTVSEVEQWFDEEFAAQFMHTTGHALVDGSKLFWRMNKIHDYGSKLENPMTLGAALTGKGLGQM